MNKKVILIAGTPQEHSIQYQYADNKRDFATRSYNYAIASIKANIYLAGNNDYEIQLMDIPVNRKMSVLSNSQIQQILKLEPSIIGFSTYCWNKHIFLNTSRLIKQFNKNLKIVMGGPSVSYNPENIIRESGDIDIIVYGDGEETFSRLLKNNFDNLNEIDGIVYKISNKIVKNKPSRTIDINNIYSPYLQNIFRPKSDVLLIEPSRGCLYRCKFCSWAKNRGLNIKDNLLLKRELGWAYENGYNYINFSDTSINMTNEQLAHIVNSLRDSRVSDKLSLSVFMKYDKIDKSQLKYIEKVKFDEIIFGLESINSDVLNGCGKISFNRKRFESVIKALGSLGNKITLSIISGLPYDTFEGMKRTIKYLEELVCKYDSYINFVCTFWLAILPGTRFEKDAIKHGFEFQRVGTPYLIKSKYLTENDLKKIAEYVYIKTIENKKFFCEEYYLEVLGHNL